MSFNLLATNIYKERQNSRLLIPNVVTLINDNLLNATQFANELSANSIILSPTI